MELILPFTACKARNRFYKFEMKFQSFCSTRSSSLCACFGASSSSNFGAMKLGIIGVTTSLSSKSSRMTVCAVSFRPCIDIHQILQVYFRNQKQRKMIVVQEIQPEASFDISFLSCLRLEVPKPK
uniref:Uncharacterized protein n=1 Tax=Cucumis sativus TaxID=3659 RepID=A0A0A0KW55_CUCSA